MGSAKPQDSWNDKNLEFTLRFGRDQGFLWKGASIDTPTLTFLQSHLSPNDSEITGCNAFRNLPTCEVQMGFALHRTVVEGTDGKEEENWAGRYWEGGGIAMPIRPELRPLYLPHWRQLSSHVRFERAGGKCQRCGHPHLALLRCLPDGRWFDEKAATWRDRRGRPARWPDLVEPTRLRMTRVVLAAAHLDSDPTNNRLKNLRALCQRCHMLHDRPHHLAQR
jgi:hypothetical protein